MPFWSTNFGQDTTLKDPKRRHRFTVEFQGVNAAQGGALLWYAKTATKPGFSINAAEHKYLGHTFYYPGIVTWDTMTIALVDPVDPELTATVSDIMLLLVTHHPQMQILLELYQKQKQRVPLVRL